MSQNKRGIWNFQDLNLPTISGWGISRETRVEFCKFLINAGGAAGIIGIILRYMIPFPKRV